jgi:hypothetical protein
MNEFQIEKGKGYDFHIIQNYVLQMVADGILNPTAYLLYGFYQSLNGFKQIVTGYEYIKANTGLSKGSISKSNKMLEKAGLIKIKERGYNQPNQIFIRDGNEIPRRELRDPRKNKQQQEEYDSIEFQPIPEESSSHEQQSTHSRSSGEQPVSEVNSGCSSDEPIHIENKYNYIDNTTTPAKQQFISSFKEYWCKMYNTDKYRIDDEDIAEDIDNYDLATKLIPVLWKLGEKDSWVRKSNYSMKVFVKEYNNGNLQSLYPSTAEYYKDLNKEERKNRNYVT